ncbi:MAG: cytochrome c [Firmicutes bacterium]|nr:cytochrome c [Bacillota bacterium]
MLKKNNLWVLLLLLLTAVIFVGCSIIEGTNDNKKPLGQETKLTGQQLVESRCSQCHTLDRLTSKERDNSEWRKQAERMLDKSPDLLTEEEYELVVSYLQEQNSKQ